MKEGEVYRLFDLIERLHGGKRISRDESTVALWDTMFKPWSYTQVGNAVIRRTRDNIYAPKPAEILAYLPSKMPADRGYIPGEIERSSMYGLRVDQEDYHRRLHDAGLPTLAEAKAHGMTAEEWDKLAGHIDFYPVVKEGAI